jgi:hypothetical protein
VSEVTQDDIDAAKARDARFRAIDLSVTVAAELRDSVALRAVLEACRGDADKAMREFAICNPADHMLVAGLQARVFRLYALERTFNFIEDTGKAAEAAIAGEDMRNENERHDY